LLLTLGSFCGLVASLVVLPVVLRLLTPAAEETPVIESSSAA
jgi:hypothetical protein